MTYTSIRDNSGGYYIRDDATGAIIPFAASDHRFSAALAAGLQPLEILPLPVPNVSRVQLLLWLLRRGVSEAAIEAAIAATVQDAAAQDEALIVFKNAQIFERSSPLVDLIGPALGLDATQLDAAFREASTL